MPNNQTLREGECIASVTAKYRLFPKRELEDMREITRMEEEPARVA